MLGFSKKKQKTITKTGFSLFTAHLNFSITLHRKVTFQVMWIPIYAKVQQIDINFMYNPNIACRFNMVCVTFILQLLSIYLKLLNVFILSFVLQ